VAINEHSSIYTSLHINRFQLATYSRCRAITIVHLVVHNLDNSIQLKFEYSPLGWKKHKLKSSVSGKHNHLYAHFLLVTGNIPGVTEIVGHRGYSSIRPYSLCEVARNNWRDGHPSIPYHKEGKDTPMTRDFRPGHFVSDNSIDYRCPFTHFVFSLMARFLAWL
ncbi:hypothetical protein GGF37_002020, partial [Kickxella alabastrina]